jgi:hypothetical protein
MKLVALIVETRPLENLKQIIESHLKYLPQNTDLIIYHGLNNKYLVKDLKAEFYKIQDNTMNNSSYNNLLTNKHFWGNLCRYDRVLIFQSDSMILREGIEEFYEKDYCGAPWRFQRHGGNGGFSLRNPKIMYDISQTYGDNYNKSKHGNEDVFFCNIMFDYKIGQLATRDECSKFSCESIFQLGTFGIHAIHKYLSEEEQFQIINQYK